MAVCIKMLFNVCGLEKCNVLRRNRRISFHHVVHLVYFTCCLFVFPVNFNLLVVLLHIFIVAIFCCDFDLLLKPVWVCSQTPTMIDALSWHWRSWGRVALGCGWERNCVCGAVCSRDAEHTDRAFVLQSEAELCGRGSLTQIPVESSVR